MLGQDINSRTKMKGSKNWELFDILNKRDKQWLHLAKCFQRINPWWHAPTGEQYLCSRNRKCSHRRLLQSAYTDPQQACRKPRTRTISTLRDKQDTRESGSDLLKTMCLQTFQCAVSCYALLSLLKQQLTIPLCSKETLLLIIYFL